MISSRRLAQMSRKWLRAVTAGRKRIASRRGGTATALDSGACTAAAQARKGFFVVYSSDGQRFEVPLAFLKSDVFTELLRMSENVFGLPSAGPIVLPCDAAFMCSVVSCLLRPSPRDAERTLLASVAAACSSSASLLAPCPLINRQLVVCGC